MTNRGRFLGGKEPGVFLFSLVLITGVGLATGRAAAPTAVLVPGQPTVPAGTQVSLTGRNFAAGETVTFSVTHLRGTPTTGTNHTPAQVVADPGGAFTASWLVCSNDCVGEMLQVSATGQSSGRVGRAVFLDLPALPPRPATWVRTDKSDYAPGTTARITGIGFQAAETVVLQVVHADGTADTGTDHTPWSVVADTAGAYQSTWLVCTDDCLHSTLKLTANGQTSGRSAQAIFTDAGGAPTFELLKSFGTPSRGAFPVSGLRRGSDGALYGTASQGGASLYGTVFKLNPDGTGLTVLHNFSSGLDGSYPQAGVVQGTDGALYGTAFQGGSGGFGTVYKLNTDGSGFTVIKDLDSSTSGAYPYAGLVQGSDGELYGATQSGGSTGNGTLFKLNPDGSGFTVLKNLDYSTMGAFPNGALIQGTDGLLYGTASGGGTSGYGTVFKINPDGSGFTVLKNFDYSTTGGDLIAGLVQGTDGALYGTARDGGSSFAGTAFKLNPDGTGFTILHNFSYGVDGGYIVAGLSQGTDGALYGAAALYGGVGFGTVFKFNADGTGFSVLQNFDSFTTGASPQGGLAQGAGGVLFGTATSGGTDNSGTLFRMNSDGSGFVVLQNLTYRADVQSDGGYPWAGPLQGNDGKLYGTTRAGGTSGYGTVFKLNTDGTGFTVLKDFDYSTTGGQSVSRLIQGLDGALYGTTTYGGGGYGTVFKLNPDGSGFTVIKTFDYYTAGGFLYGAVMQGIDGALYGTTANGGSGFGGTVFKLNPDGTGFTVLKNFFNYDTGGSNPQAGLVQGADGVLYGTTSFGGTSGSGTVFKLNPDGTGFTVLISLDYFTAGAAPRGLLFGLGNVLYGTANNGGSFGYGTVFKLNPDGSGFTVLQNFDYSTTGGYPYGAMVEGTDGNIYGTTGNGGSGSVGTVFRLHTDGSGFTVLQNLDSTTTGAYPFGDLLQATDGNIYGTTSEGGDANAGTVYRLVFAPTLPPNNPPVARCRNVTVSADASCTAAASIDNGSSDPDSGDTITLTQTPPGPYPLGNTLVTLTVTDNHGASSTCSSTVTVVDTTPPSISCPGNMSVGCSIDRLAVVTYPAPVVSDSCDPHPTVTCTPASGTASFPIGVTTVICQAVDAAGNPNSCSFTVTRAPLGFTGFLSPIGGEVALGTGGSFGNPLRAFKFGSTIPIRFSANCGGTPVSAGVHTLQATKYSSAVDSDPVIDATPTGGATTGNQFQLTDATTGEWHFNLDTKPLSVGTWKLSATLSDGSVHEAWITIRK